MLSIKKINAGAGYEYYTRSVGHADADYYLRGTTTGTDPPGMWMGRGAALELAVTGQASEEQVKRLFGLGVHPEHSDQPLGRPFPAPSYAGRVGGRPPERRAGRTGGDAGGRAAARQPQRRRRAGSDLQPAQVLERAVGRRPPPPAPGHVGRPRHRRRRRAGVPGTARRVLPRRARRHPPGRNQRADGGPVRPHHQPRR